MHRTGIFIASLLVTAAPAALCAQQSEPVGKPEGQAAPPATGLPEGMIFRDANGKPLPADVQAQLLEHFRKNPDAAAALTAKANADSPNKAGEITVSGQRPRGSVMGDVPAERSFRQDDIRAYGASTVEELLDALGPQVASNRGRGSDGPVTLLNGRRVSDFTEIARIPTEAIERMDVFPEELALQYGYRADQKVVNVVTFARFDSQFGQISGAAATAGGWTSGSVNADHFQIAGDTRFSLAVRYDRSGPLLESDRDIVQPVVAYEAGINGRFRTLMPRSERAELNGLVARPLNETISATLNAKFEMSRSESLLGRAAGSRTTDEPLRREIDRQGLRLGTTINGRSNRWQWNLTGNYDLSHSEIGSIATGSERTRATASSRAATFDAGLLLNGPLAELPSGPLLTSIRGGVQIGNFDTVSSLDGSTGKTDLVRRTGGVRFSLNAPLLGGGAEAGSPIGKLSINANLALESVSDVGRLFGYGYGLAWSPRETVDLIASVTGEEGAPSLQQLGGPFLETPNTRTFDFRRNAVVDVSRISGGNPFLSTESRDVLRIGLGVRPINGTDLSLSADFVSTQIDNPIASFPIVLPELETAFSERFTRDVDPAGVGRLVRIDARPVNFARSDQRQLRLGVNFTRPLGPIPAGMAAGSGRTFANAEEARRAFPGAMVIVAEPGSPLARQGGNTRSRVFASLYHTWYLKDEITLREGLSSFDLLDGGAVDFAGGRRRHEIAFQGGLFKRGLGARLTASWRSGTDLRGGGESASVLQFDSLTTFDLNLFADLTERFGGAQAPGWLKGTRASFGITNLFDTKQQVRDSARAIPLAYQPDYLDPLGRTVSLSLRKVF